MRTSLMRRLRLSGKRFDIEPEITGRVLRLGHRIHEVPVNAGRGEEAHWSDGLKR